MHARIDDFDGEATHSGEGDELSSEFAEVPFEVRPEEHGTRADLFVIGRLRRLSRSKAAAAIRVGFLRREGSGVIDRPSTRVHAGERLFLRRPKLEEAPIDDIHVPILLDDPDVLAVNKPGDLIVHPTASAYNRTLIRVLKVRLPGAYLDLAHRIDKETSGVLLLARSQAASSKLKTQFADRRVTKVYLAIVIGSPSFEQVTVDAPMRLAPQSASGVLMEVGGAGASPAVTEVRVIARGRDAALVEARPHTGRQHQIRLHLAHLGHPLVGDKLYLGGESTFVASLRGGLDASDLVSQLGHHRQALHAHRVRFLHPTTRLSMEVIAPLAPDLFEVARTLHIQVPEWGATIGDPGPR
ncbi:MAG: RluA family pseudouridine synthase [Deltaproteobacteria bacterium]|nr:RluA family pseudouridine synthase [Deltaproteobacteria bacterium]